MVDQDVVAPGEEHGSILYASVRCRRACIDGLITSSTHVMGLTYDKDRYNAKFGIDEAKIQKALAEAKHYFS
jgi:hypothetical protein